MGLKESIQSAVSSVMASLPDATVSVVYRGSSFDAISGSVSTKTVDTALADAADGIREITFPASSCAKEIEYGELIKINGNYRVVKSASQDALGATWKVECFNAYNRIAAVSGKRREDGATRALSLTCACSVVFGELMDISDHSYAAKSAREVTIEVLQENWPDHTEPQKGDVFDVNGYGEMKVRARPYVDDKSFVIECAYKRD